MLVKMRLLDVDTYQFVVIQNPRQRTRVGKSVDRYAILSHTWDAEGQELSYQDWQVWLRKDSGFEEIQIRSGFTKIMDTCHMAKKMGYSQVWIDTICIDKSSSAELSEAINSMFAFYTHSAVCLAFLSDVNEADGDEGFMRSRWFTRGWTLQELLAPKDVQFFDRRWKPLCSKYQLEETGLISKTTGIPNLYLLNIRPLSSASIAERMSWAAKRVTTRVEDASYCLLGIFDINMPLLYGEADKALLRLQEEILKVSTDQSIFTWSWLPEFCNSFMGPGGTSWVTFLAPDVRCFANTASTYGPVDWEPHEDVAGRIYSMTNLGLQIRLPLIHTCSNRSYAPLRIRRLDDLGNSVFCVPVMKVSSGTFIRCGWPDKPVAFPRWVLKRHLRHADNIFLGREGSRVNWRSLFGPMIRLSHTPQSDTGGLLPLFMAFQMIFCKPGKYRLFKIAHTKGVTFANEHSILGVVRDDFIDASPPVMEEETFRGAVFFLRQTNVEISRLQVQVLVGLRQMGTGSRRTSALYLGISRKTIPDAGDATVKEVEGLCEELQDKTPSVEHVERLFAPRHSDRELTAAGNPTTMEVGASNPGKVLKHARHRTYNAAIAEPIEATLRICDSTIEHNVRPYPVFVWEELGSRHSRRRISEASQQISDTGF